MAELAALAETAGSEVLEGLIQRRDKPDPSTYIGSGKAQELREVVRGHRRRHRHLRRRAEPRAAQRAGEGGQGQGHRPHRADPRHLRPARHQPARARRRWRWRRWSTCCPGCAAGVSRCPGRPVAAPAAAAAAWVLRGPGETKIETDRRRIRERMAKLRREIKDMKKIRDTQRSRRLRSDVAVDRDRRLHQRGQVQPAQRADRRGRAGRERAVRHPRTHHPPWGVRRRPAVRADRHRRVRAAPAHPAGRGVPLDAGGGRRRRPAGARRRRLRRQPAGPDQRGARRWSTR